MRLEPITKRVSIRNLTVGYCNQLGEPGPRRGPDPWGKREDRRLDSHTSAICRRRTSSAMGNSVARSPQPASMDNLPR